MSALLRISAVVALLVSTSGSTAQASMSYLDNGKVSVGVDLAAGGTITHLARAGGPNLINSYDLGREVQPSFYAGPMDFGQTEAPYSPWPWNPVTAGDFKRNASTVIEARNDGAAIYVRTRPKQWGNANVDCECVIEQWITLDGQAVHVRNRLTNARTDPGPFDALQQELPAAFFVASLRRLVTYDGQAPYTGGPLTERPPTWPASYFFATEHWAAFVDASGQGVGVFNPGALYFAGGVCDCGGDPNARGPKDLATSYIAPHVQEILDPDIVYDYAYDLVVGSVADIRAFASARRPDPRPDYVFAADRQHFTLEHATDTGWPLGGSLKVSLAGADPQLVGPDALWDAAAVPRIYVRAAFSTRNDEAELFWNVPGAGFSAARSARFRVIGDGRFHTYAIDLAGLPGYAGPITRLRLDPTEGGDAHGTAEIASISWRNPDATPAPAAPAPDTQAPRVRVSARRRQPPRRRAVRLRIRCDEPCRAVARGTLRGKRSARLRAWTGDVTPERPATARLRLRRGQAARVRAQLRRGRKARVRIRVAAHDAAGNAARATAAVRLVARAPRARRPAG